MAAIYKKKKKPNKKTESERLFFKIESKTIIATLYLNINS